LFIECRCAYKTISIAIEIRDRSAAWKSDVNAATENANPKATTVQPKATT